MPRYTPAHVFVFATSFACMAILNRIALDSGAHALSVVTVRSVLVVIILAIFLRLSGLGLQVDRRERRLSFALGAILSVNAFSLTYAVGHLPVPLVVLILYSFPAMTCLAGWLLGTERPTGRTAFAVLLALAGLAIALNADLSALNAPGLVAALMAALSSAVTLLFSVRYLPQGDSRPRAFYNQMVLAAVFVAATLVTGIVQPPQGAAGWSAMAGVPLAYALGMVGLLSAVGTLGATNSAFYMNFEPIVTISLSALVLGQTLSPVQAVGGAMVIAALFLFRPLRRDPLPPA